MVNKIKEQSYDQIAVLVSTLGEAEFYVVLEVHEDDMHTMYMFSVVCFGDETVVDRKTFLPNIYSEDEAVAKGIDWFYNKSA